eukprot:9958567-Lingulodinium_polyedra.AAC.1
MASTGQTRWDAMKAFFAPFPARAQNSRQGEVAPADGGTQNGGAGEWHRWLPEGTVVGNPPKGTA